ncbi:hypothetical protein [Clostridium butyricum]
MELFDERKIRNNRNKKGINTLIDLIELGFERECYDCLRAVYNMILNIKSVKGEDGLLYANCEKVEVDMNEVSIKFKDLVEKTDRFSRDDLIEMTLNNYKLTASDEEINSRIYYIKPNDNDPSTILKVGTRYDTNNISSLDSLQEKLIEKLKSI